MHRQPLSRLDDAALLQSLAALLADDRSTTSSILAHLAEVEARDLHRRAAYPSMLAYCVGELRMSEDSACRRPRAARAARDFPVLFDALVDGRLHLSALVLLAPRASEMREGASEVPAKSVLKNHKKGEKINTGKPCNYGSGDRDFPFDLGDTPWARA